MQQNPGNSDSDSSYVDAGSVQGQASYEHQPVGSAQGSDHIPQSSPQSPPQEPTKPPVSRSITGIFLCVFVLLSLGLLGAVIFFATNPGKEVHIVERISVCRNTFCRRSAEDLQAIMDTTIDPCNDFYNYTCGNWKTKFPVNDNVPQTSPLVNLQLRIFENLSNILKTLPKSKTPRGIASLLYHSCVADSQNDRKDDLQRLVNQFNGWPILSNPNSAVVNDNLGSIIDYTLDALIMYNVKVIFNIQVLPDLTERGKFVLGVSKSDFISQYGRNYFPRGRNYATIGGIENIVCLLNTKCQSLNYLEKDIDHMNSLDEKLKDVSQSFLYSSKFERSNNETSEDEEIKITLKRLNDVAPLKISNKNWVNIARYILKDASIDENYGVLAEPDVINKILDIFRGTDIRVIKNWFVLQLILQLGSRFSGLFQPEGTNNDMRCAQEVNRLMPYAAAEIYTEYWSRTPHKKEKVLKMFEEIRERIYKLVDSSSWLDDEGRSTMLKKLKNLIPFVAYPDWILNGTELSNYYEIKMDLSESYIDISRKLLELEWPRESEQLKKTLDRNTYWIRSDLLQGNAWYSPMTNSLTMPIGILDYPFIGDVYQPSSVIFGMLGHIVAHEIFHSLDNEGIRFDEHGQFRKQNPFSEIVTENYIKILKCLTDQYNEIGGNGDLTISEDFPDNAAVETVYGTYRALGSDLFFDDLLHTFNQTLSKQFYIAYAAAWCTETLEEYLQFAMNDVHSLGRFRVNIPLRNSPEFSEVFQCPSGSPMNPHHKCRIF